MPALFWYWLFYFHSYVPGVFWGCTWISDAATGCTCSSTFWALPTSMANPGSGDKSLMAHVSHDKCCFGVQATSVCSWPDVAILDPAQQDQPTVCVFSLPWPASFASLCLQTGRAINVISSCANLATPFLAPLQRCVMPHVVAQCSGVHQLA